MQYRSSFLQEPEAFSTTQYDTGAECDGKVKALLWLVEQMFEDEPTKPLTKKDRNGVETSVYTNINKCGPNPGETDGRRQLESSVLKRTMAQRS